MQGRDRFDSWQAAVKKLGYMKSGVYRKLPAKGTKAYDELCVMQSRFEKGTEQDSSDDDPANYEDMFTISPKSADNGHYTSFKTKRLNDTTVLVKTARKDFWGNIIEKFAYESWRPYEDPEKRYNDKYDAMAAELQARVDAGQIDKHEKEKALTDYEIYLDYKRGFI